MDDLQWSLRRKHIFILSSSGKPIFCNNGDEQELVTIFGLLQAVISIVNDSNDKIQCIRSKKRKIVYFLRNSLYFISISSTGEPEAILKLHLEFLYHQILLILTSQVQNVLENNSSKDIRDLLGPETNRLFQAACMTDIITPCIAFQCVKSYCLSKELRDEINAILRLCVDNSGAV